MLVFILSALLSLTAVLGAPSAAVLEKIDMPQLEPTVYQIPDFNVENLVPELAIESNVNPDSALSISGQIDTSKQLYTKSPSNTGGGRGGAFLTLSGLTGIAKQYW